MHDALALRVGTHVDLGMIEQMQRVEAAIVGRADAAAVHSSPREAHAAWDVDHARIHAIGGIRRREIEAVARDQMHMTAERRLVRRFVLTGSRRRLREALIRGDHEPPVAAIECHLHRRHDGLAVGVMHRLARLDHRRFLILFVGHSRRVLTLVVDLAREGRTGAPGRGLAFVNQEKERDGEAQTAQADYHAR